MRIKSILGLFLLVLLMSAPVLATITVTWNSPTAGTTYINNAANRKTIDLNFSYSDSNTSTDNDFNFTVRVLNAGDYSVHSTLLTDQNVFDLNANPTGALSCSVMDSKVAGSCHYHWVMPLNDVLGDGSYILDVNVVEYLRVEHDVVTDTNAGLAFSVSTGMANAESTRALMSMVGMVLAAIVLLGGLGSIVWLKTDIAKTAMVTVVAAIAVAIASQIIGTVLIAL